MKVKVYDWEKFDTNGLLEIKVDKKVLELLINQIEKHIRACINNDLYSDGKAYIEMREKLLGKLTENNTDE